MIITCKKCSTSYNLDETLLNPGGTKVRCTACKTIFTAYPAASQENTHLYEDSYSDHPESMEVPDDLAGILGQGLNEKDPDSDEEINHLPPNMVHEIEDDEEVGFSDPAYEESFQEDDFNLSSDTFDFSSGDENFDQNDDLSTDDIELSPEDLDLVKGYQTESFDTQIKDEPKSKPKSLQEKEVPATDISYDDGPVTLSEDDLDLGVSMAAQALADDFAVEAESHIDSKISTLSKSIPREEKIETAKQGRQIEDESIDAPQIDIGAELDIEFGSEMEDEILDSSFDDDLDIDLTLDDSEEEKVNDNEKAEPSNEEQISLADDFGGAFIDDGILDDEDEFSLKFDSEPENIISDEAIENELQLDIGDDKDKDNDFDLKIDFETEEKKEDTASEDFDLSLAGDDDLGLELDFDEGEKQKDAASEDLDLSLAGDDDLGLELEFDEGKKQDDAASGDFDLSLSEDDDLGLNIDFEGDNQKKESAEDLEFSLGKDNDFDLGLDFDEEEKQGDAASEDLELSLAEDDDFGLDLEEGEEKEEAVESLDLSLDKDNDLDLNLDFDGGEKQEDAAPEDLGLSLAGDDDFGLDLDFEADEGKEDTAEDLDLSLAGDGDLDLDLDFDEGGKEEGVVSEDLDLSLAEDDGLELDFSDNEATEEMSTSDDLDLSDLQDLLDSDQEKEKPSIASDAPDDFDLSDLENVLENDEETDVKASQRDDEELELDLDIESDLAETVAVSSPGKDFSSELDLSEFEYISDSDEKSPADDHFDTGDMELEFQVEDSPKEAQPEPIKAGIKSSSQQSLEEPEDIQKTLSLDESPFTENAEITDEDEIEEEPASAQKRGLSKTLIFLLVIVILFGGGYCVYVLIDGMGIEIPFLSNYLDPKIEDPGNLKLTTEDINSKFIDNTTAGRMFVITGKAKSNYDSPRRFVQMTGKLYTKGKKLAKTEIVYAGNVISDTELTTLDINLIKKRLADRFGGNQKSVTTIEPGQTLPFMVVFSDLPKDQLEEFTIEVDKSTEAD